MIRNFLLALTAIALSGCATHALSPDMPDAAAPVTVRVIGINDFHGNLEPMPQPVEVDGADGARLQVPVGGAAYLASAIAERRAQNPYNMVIAAGDMISASPLVSSLFLDEPAIGVMNRIGIDFNAVGNHEFDRGRDELLRIQNGGCEQYGLRAPCQIENPYPGADFAFLAANVVVRETGDTLFPATGIRRFGEGKNAVTIGVIGLTLKDTSSLVMPSSVEGLDFTDEAKAINGQISGLLKQGADAIIVAVHQGLYTEVGYNDKSCGGVSGPLLDILGRLDPRVDLVISGHTHWAYICDYGTVDASRPFLVTSAGYGGSYITDIALTIDPTRNAVIAKKADNVIVQNTGIAAREGKTAPAAAFKAFLPDPAVAAYVATYSAAAKEYTERVIGRISAEAPKPASAMQESALGNLIADSQLAATRNHGAQIALMNNSGVRAPLVPDEQGNITFGALFAVQPFGNALETRSYSGAQLLALLEQQFDSQGFPQTFSVSEGFSFEYDLARPEGQRILSAALNGKPVDPSQTYRVTMNSFLASGGDGFSVFTHGTEPAGGPSDLEAIEAWLAAVTMRTLPQTGRVRDLTPARP